MILRRSSRPASSFIRRNPILMDALLVVGTACLVGYAVTLTASLARTPGMKDFGDFFYSGRAYLRFGLLYGAIPPGIRQLDGTSYVLSSNLNPPHFTLLMLPLAPLHPWIALAVWMTASLACLGRSLQLICRECQLALGERDRLVAMLGLLAFSATAAVVALGQVSWVLMLPATIAWVRARHDRWENAGWYLGLVAAIKPFLLVFVPYLLMRRQWRAAASMAAAVLGSYSLGMLVFGPQLHLAWLHSLNSVTWPWIGMNASLLGFASRCLSPNQDYLPVVGRPDLVRFFWFIGTAFVLFAVLVYFGRVQTKSASVDRDFLILLLGSLLVSPLGWLYYFWFLLGPLAGYLTSFRWWLAGTTWRVALVIAIPGLLWPPGSTRLFQPNALATVLVGSVYFWTTLALWVAVLSTPDRSE